MNWSGKFYHLQQNESVQSAAWYMAARGLSALAVSMNATLVGVFTAEDVLTRVISLRSEPARTRLIEVMHLFPLIVSDETPIDEALALLRESTARHVVVSRTGSPSIADARGLLSRAELAEYMLAELLGESDGHSQIRLNPALRSSPLPSVTGIMDDAFSEPPLGNTQRVG
jgi:signal-transduction protein with cAMP-binding, CBS, and nucleotidyltransferase domain